MELFREQKKILRKIREVLGKNGKILRKTKEVKQIKKTLLNKNGNVEKSLENFEDIQENFKKIWIFKIVR